MEPLKTEAVGHITYGPHEPTAFMLSDDLLDACLGDKKHRILALNTFEATGEVEIECCEEAD